LDATQTITALARDLTFILLLATAPLLGLAMYLKVTAIVRSARKATRTMEGIGATLSDGFVKPSIGGRSPITAVGKLAGFLRRRSRRGKDQDGTGQR
jgi:hypothetical protein